MTSNIVVVVGGSRGIGLELTKQLAEDLKVQVVTTMRKPFNLEFSNVEVLGLDQRSSESVQRAASKVPEADILIVNAAIGDKEFLTQVSPERLSEYLDTNVVGVHRVINAFLPALRTRQTRKIIYISSLVGSMTMEVGKKIGIRGPYAVSKAAGNMLTVQFHNELHDEGFIVVAIHPGWVATEMGNLAGPGAMPAAQAVRRILRIIHGLKGTDGAKFFDNDGSILPW